MPKGRAAPLPRTAQSRKPASGARSQSVKGLCKACWTTDSPQWRKGPDDYDELCNACGTKWSRCVKQTNAKGWADYVSRKRTAQNHHLQLKYHHERQLESLTRLLNCQEQLSSQQPVSNWHTSVPAVPVDNADASPPLIFPGILSLQSQSSSLQFCPVEGSACPVEGSACPVEGPICPVEGLSCPVEGPVCPVEGSACPVARPICPVEGSVCPVEGSSRPAQGPFCPVVGRSCPVEGSIPPVRSSAYPAESLPGPVVGYTVQGSFANIQTAEGLCHAPNSRVHPEEGCQHRASTLPVPRAPAAQAASSSPIAATPPIVIGGLVEADMAAVHELAGHMEADAVAAAMGLTALKSAPAPAECAGFTSRQRQKEQLTAATSQRAQPQHQRHRISNNNSGTSSTDSAVTTRHQLTSADFSAKSRQQHQTDIAAAPLAAGKNYHSRPSRFHPTLGALQRPQHHAADHAAACSLHEQQSAASGNSTRLLRQLPIRHPHIADKAPSGFTQQHQTAAPAKRGCNAELAVAQPASSAELSTTDGFHDDRSQSYLLNNHRQAQSQLSALSDARAFLATAKTADAGSRAVPDGPEDPQSSIGAGSLRPAQDGLPAFQTTGNASRAVCNGPEISTGTMGPVSGASTATCSGLEPLPQSTSRHDYDDMSSAQPTEQIHDSAMLDAVMAEANEEPASYSRRGRRICLPARFQAMPYQEPKQALRRQKRRFGDEDSGPDHLPMVKKQCMESQDIPVIPAHCSQPARHPQQPPTRRPRVAKAAGRKPKARRGARQDVPMTQAVSEAADVLMSPAGF